MQSLPHPAVESFAFRVHNVGDMSRSTTQSPAKTCSPQVLGVDRAAVLTRGQAVLDAESNAINDAKRRLGDSFVRSVEVILNCRGRVCVTGVGKAGLIGAKIQATLASTGTLSYSLHPVEALHGDLGMVHADDVVLALSKSGGSELVELLPRLRNLGCIIILLTANPSSPAASAADEIIEIGQTAEACPLGLAPSSSTAAMLALGDALALCVMELRGVQAEQYASYHPGGALGRYLMKSREIMRTSADCPKLRETDTIHSFYAAIRSAPHRAGAAAVVDAAGKLIGIFTQGDFLRLFSTEEGLRNRPVGEVMTRSPKFVGQDERVVDALRLMRNHAIDELPVVDDEHRLVGMIDIQDLVARGFSVFDNA